MKNNSCLAIIILCCLMLVSCEKDEGVSLGEVKYYPQFLFSDSKIEPVTKCFDLEFSQDAQRDNTCYAEFQFVDNDGTPVNTRVMQVKVDGKAIKDNVFRVTSKETQKELTFTFTPEAKQGKHQGYLRLVSHNLDRLDSQQLVAGQQVDALQWTIYFNKSMNPLAKTLMWVGIAILGLLALWFLFGRWIVYDYIKVGSIRITEPYYTSRRIKGARQVVFTNKVTKQSFLNRLFTGTVIYEINPIWTTPVVLESSSRGDVKMQSNPKYSIEPFELVLKKQEEYTFINEETKERIKLTIY